jgi:hypothetical protein
LTEDSPVVVDRRADGATWRAVRVQAGAVVWRAEVVNDMKLADVLPQLRNALEVGARDSYDTAIAVLDAVDPTNASVPLPVGTELGDETRAAALRRLDALLASRGSESAGVRLGDAHRRRRFRRRQNSSSVASRIRTLTGFPSVLPARGAAVVHRVTVPDERGAIAEAGARRHAACNGRRGRGGLGPTLDDLTRDGLAEAFGRISAPDPELAERLSARTRARGRPLTESTLRQADVPEGCKALDNPVGTAPAILRTTDEGLVLAVAGVPIEFRTLIERHLFPRLDALPGGEPRRIPRPSRCAASPKPRSDKRFPG